MDLPADVTFSAEQVRALLQRRPQRSYVIQHPQHQTFVLLVDADAYGPGAQQLAADRACRLVCPSFFSGDAAASVLDSPDPPPIFARPVPDDPCMFRAWRRTPELPVGEPYLVMPVDCFAVGPHDQRLTLQYHD
jgi:hypothetical protein